MIKCENGLCRRLARRRRWLVLRGQIDAEEAVVAAASTHLRWRGIRCAPMCCARERFGTGESVEGANLAARTGSPEVVCATTLTCPPEVADAPPLAGARWRRPLRHRSRLPVLRHRRALCITRLPPRLQPPSQHACRLLRALPGHHLRGRRDSMERG